MEEELEGHWFILICSWAFSSFLSLVFIGGVVRMLYFHTLVKNGVDPEQIQESVQTEQSE